MASLVAALARVEAREREPRLVVGGIRFELLAKLVLSRALLAAARERDALAHGFDARRVRRGRA